jgi:hypothetical protein
MLINDWDLLDQKEKYLLKIRARPSAAEKLFEVFKFEVLGRET